MNQLLIIEHSSLFDGVGGFLTSAAYAQISFM